MPAWTRDDIITKLYTKRFSDRGDRYDSKRSSLTAGMGAGDQDRSGAGRPGRVGGYLVFIFG